MPTPLPPATQALHSWAIRDDNPIIPELDIFTTKINKTKTNKVGKRLPSIVW